MCREIVHSGDRNKHRPTLLWRFCFRGGISERQRIHVHCQCVRCSFHLSASIPTVTRSSGGVAACKLEDCVGLANGAAIGWYVERDGYNDRPSRTGRSRYPECDRGEPLADGQFESPRSCRAYRDSPKRNSTSRAAVASHG